MPPYVGPRTQCRCHNRHRIQLLRLPRYYRDDRVSLVMLPVHLTSMGGLVPRVGAEEAGGSVLVEVGQEPNQELEVACWSSYWDEEVEEEKMGYLHRSCMMLVWRL
jgi:hypothetical protein